MALYLGRSEKLKINIANAVCRFVISSQTPAPSGITLLSFDNYILKDSNGVKLTAKESK